MDTTPQPQQRVEQVFHDQIWGVANDWMKIERAVAEARDNCYLVLKHTDAGTLLHDEATRWLDTFGHDTFRESKEQAA